MAVRARDADPQAALRILLRDDHPVGDVIQLLSGGDPLRNAGALEPQSLIVGARVHISLAIDGEGDLVAFLGVFRGRVQNPMNDSLCAQVRAHVSGDRFAEDARRFVRRGRVPILRGIGFFLRRFRLRLRGFLRLLARAFSNFLGGLALALGRLESRFALFFLLLEHRVDALRVFLLRLLHR